MRIVVVGLVLAASSAAADPGGAPAPVPMTGPYARIDDACAAAVARIGAGAQCRVLERTSAGAVLVIDRGPVDGLHDRDYTLVLLRGGAWWLSPVSSSLDLTGNAWGAGNCCSGRAGAPRTTTLAPAGFAIGVRTELEVWRVFRHGWGSGDAGPHQLVGDYVLCGERPGDAPACITFPAARCRVGEAPQFALTATTVATSCTAVP